MLREVRPKIALIWERYLVNRDDRAAALAERLEGRADVLAIEVATTTELYADFPPSGTTGKATKRTLFPGRSFDDIKPWRRFLAMFRAVSRCKIVCIGVPYSKPDILLLVWVLRLLGRQVILATVSKFDDYPRASGFEFAKRLVLAGFRTILVPGVRSFEYYQFLGFGRHQILYGGNSICIERVRSQAASGTGALPTAFADRDFFYVGRLIEKKNLSLLIDAFARYCALEPSSTRKLVLIGSGPLEAKLREEADRKAPEGRVEFAGFLSESALYGRMAKGLGLVLVSISEQWGEVINEALALDLPVIVSEAPGARDVLVRNLVNGFVLEKGSVEGIARAMQQLGADEAAWKRMSDASRARAPLADVAVFADAIESLFDPAAAGRRSGILSYIAAVEEFEGPPPLGKLDRD
jgi:L-malate glycosyltransferase